MESHGILMVVKLLPHIQGTMREFTFGLQMLMKIMTATIQLTKGTALWMHSRQMVASGMTPTAMVLATIQTLQQHPTPVLTNSGHRLRIDSAALTVMVMAGLMTVIGRQMTRSNGLILMAMVMVINITLKW